MRWRFGGAALVGVLGASVAAAAAPKPVTLRFDVAYSGSFRYSNDQRWDATCPAASFAETLNMSSLVMSQKGIRITTGRTTAFARRGQARVAGTWTLKGQTGVEACAQTQPVDCAGGVVFGPGGTESPATMKIVTRPTSVRIQFDLDTLEEEGTEDCIPFGDFTALPYFALADLTPYYDHVYATVSTAALKAAAKAKRKLTLPVRSIQPVSGIQQCPGADEHSTCKATWTPLRRVTLTFR